MLPFHFNIILHVSSIHIQKAIQNGFSIFLNQLNMIKSVHINVNNEKSTYNTVTPNQY